MSFLRSIQLGNRANFCRRWGTVALVLQPGITFCGNIIVIIAMLGAGGYGNVQKQSKTKDVISAFPEQHVTIIATVLPNTLESLTKRSMIFPKNSRLSSLLQKKSETL